MHPNSRRVEDYVAMYERIRCNAPAEAPTKSPSSNPSDPDVTPTPPAVTPPTSNREPAFEDVLEDPEFDQISDWDELEEDYLFDKGDPLVVRRRAMAADFSEGRLETFVGSPQKELAGTQNQYVSYQVTTKVGRSALA